MIAALDLGGVHNVHVQDFGAGVDQGQDRSMARKIAPSSRMSRADLATSADLATILDDFYEEDLFLPSHPSKASSGHSAVGADARRHTLDEARRPSLSRFTSSVTKKMDSEKRSSVTKMARVLPARWMLRRQSRIKKQSLCKSTACLS